MPKDIDRAALAPGLMREAVDCAVSQPDKLVPREVFRVRLLVEVEVPDALLARELRLRRRLALRELRFQGSLLEPAIPGRKLRKLRALWLRHDQLLRRDQLLEPHRARIETVERDGDETRATKRA